MLRVDIACAGAALLRELLRMIYSSTAFAGVLLIALQLAALLGNHVILPLWSRGAAKPGYLSERQEESSEHGYTGVLAPTPMRRRGAKPATHDLKLA